MISRANLIRQISIPRAKPIRQRNLQSPLLDIRNDTWDRPIKLGTPIKTNNSLSPHTKKWRQTVKARRERHHERINRGHVQPYNSIQARRERRRVQQAVRRAEPYDGVGVNDQRKPDQERWEVLIQTGWGRDQTLCGPAQGSTFERMDLDFGKRKNCGTKRSRTKYRTKRSRTKCRTKRRTNRMTKSGTKRRTKRRS